MTSEPLFVYAHLNARVMPVDRGDRYEDPLQEAFDVNGLGAVTGGGSMLAASGEIDFCGIDIDLFDVERGLRFVGQFLAECGAPKGSRLEYSVGEEPRQLPFGFLEGLGLYLNGTELPDEVYELATATWSMTRSTGCWVSGARSKAIGKAPPKPPSICTATPQPRCAR